jgi:NAD(P)-dependent dehydrogenase (short-subunit alcohol dehydrogenase family)
MTDQPHEATHALVTGGSQGLGLAICRQLIADGCRKLVFTTRDPHKGDRVATELVQSGAEVHFLTLDMADTDKVQVMVPAAAERIGKVTALVNCAANTDRGSILDTTPAQWDAIMDVNAKGPFFALQGFANHCIDEGHGGMAVNILSMVVYCGLPFLAPYSASKATLLNITKNAANTLARHRIRVNGINVGWMDTPGEDATQKKWHDRSEGWLAEAEANLPFESLVKPEHVAWQTSFLLGPHSGVVTGSIIDFDQQVVGAYPDTNDS